MVIKYQCFLDKEHIEFFKDMISELQPYDTAYPFKYSIYGLHKLDCMWATNDDITDVNTCACNIFYQRYKTVEKYLIYITLFLKIFNLYNTIFNLDK